MHSIRSKKPREIRHHYILHPSSISMPNPIIIHQTVQTVFFFFCLWFAFWWKYLVFRSPSLTQFSFNRCLQNCSSRSSNRFNLPISSFFCSINSSVKGWFKRYVSLSSTFLISFGPNLALLQAQLVNYILVLLIFSVTWYIGKPFTTYSHLFRTTSTYSSCIFQNSS